MISASSSEKYKEIEELIALFPEDWINQFSKVEENFYAIKFIKDFAFLDRNREFSFPKGVSIYKIWLDEKPDYQKTDDGIDETKKYSIELAATFNGKTIGFVFNGLYKPEFQFGF
jgi:hypothetical protein